jgi:hypothetical protein
MIFAGKSVLNIRLLISPLVVTLRVVSFVMRTQLYLNVRLQTEPES